MFPTTNWSKFFFQVFQLFLNKQLARCCNYFGESNEHIFVTLKIINISRLTQQLKVLLVLFSFSEMFLRLTRQLEWLMWKCAIIWTHLFLLGITDKLYYKCLFLVNTVDSEDLYSPSFNTVMYLSDPNQGVMLAEIGLQKEEQGIELKLLNSLTSKGLWCHLQFALRRKINTVLCTV